MRKGVVQRHIEQCLLREHEKGLCFAPATQAERMALSRRVAAGEIVRPFPELYAMPSFWDAMSPLGKAMCLVRSVTRLHPDWVFCSYTAALVYGLYVPYRCVERLHVCTTRRAHSRSAGMVERHRVNGPIEVLLVNGVRVTSLPQTVFDCVRDAPLSIGLGIVDAALRYYPYDRGKLAEQVRVEGSRRHGVERAIRAVSLGDESSENGGESYLRGRIIELGYMSPSDLQVELPDPVDTQRTVRVDMMWSLPNDKKVIGELDGYVKYEDEECLHGRSIVRVLVDERQRESRLTALGYPVAKFLYARLDESGYVAAVLDAFGIPRIS